MDWNATVRPPCTCIAVVVKYLRKLVSQLGYSLFSRKVDWKKGPFLPQISSKTPFQDVEKQYKAEVNFFMMWHIFEGVVVCCLLIFFVLAR